MDKRTILAVVLSLGVLLTYQVFFAKPQIPPQPAAATKQQAVETRKEAVSTPVVAPQISTAKKTGPKSTAAPRDIKVETAQYTAIFSTRGGALKSFQLKGYQKDCIKCTGDIYPRIKNFITGSKEPLPPKSKALVELVDIKDGMPYPLAVTFPDSSIDIMPDAVYEADKTKLDLLNTKEKQRLVFSQKYDNKIKVEKIFTFNPDNYTISLDVKVYNLTDSPLSQTAKLSWQQYANPEHPEDSYGHLVR